MEPKRYSMELMLTLRFCTAGSIPPPELVDDKEPNSLWDPCKIYGSVPVNFVGASSPTGGYHNSSNSNSLSCNGGGNGTVNSNNRTKNNSFNHHGYFSNHSSDINRLCEEDKLVLMPQSKQRNWTEGCHVSRSTCNGSSSTFSTTTSATFKTRSNNSSVASSNRNSNNPRHTYYPRERVNSGSKFSSTNQDEVPRSTTSSTVEDKGSSSNKRQVSTNGGFNRNSVFSSGNNHYRTAAALNHSRREFSIDDPQSSSQQHHHNQQQQQQPEWMFAGPERYDDTIELSGIHEDDEQMVNFKRHSDPNSLCRRAASATEVDKPRKLDMLKTMEFEDFPSEDELTNSIRLNDSSTTTTTSEDLAASDSAIINCVSVDAAQSSSTAAVVVSGKSNLINLSELFPGKLCEQSAARPLNNPGQHNPGLQILNLIRGGGGSVSSDLTVNTLITKLPQISEPTFTANHRANQLETRAEMESMLKSMLLSKTGSSNPSQTENILSNLKALNVPTSKVKTLEEIEGAIISQVESSKSKEPINCESTPAVTSMSVVNDVSESVGISQQIVQPVAAAAPHVYQTPLIGPLMPASDQPVEREDSKSQDLHKTRMRYLVEPISGAELISQQQQQQQQQQQLRSMTQIPAQIPTPFFGTNHARPIFRSVIGTSTTAANQPTAPPSLVSSSANFHNFISSQYTQSNNNVIAARSNPTLSAFLSSSKSNSSMGLENLINFNDNDAGLAANHEAFTNHHQHQQQIQQKLWNMRMLNAAALASAATANQNPAALNQIFRPHVELSQSNSHPLGLENDNISLSMNPPMMAGLNVGRPIMKQQQQHNHYNNQTESTSMMNDSNLMQMNCNKPSTTTNSINSMFNLQAANKLQPPHQLSLFTNNSTNNFNDTFNALRNSRLSANERLGSQTHPAGFTFPNLSPRGLNVYGGIEGGEYVVESGSQSTASAGLIDAHTNLRAALQSSWNGPRRSKEALLSNQSAAAAHFLNQMDH